MGREIRLRVTSYCSRSRILYSAGTSYVFCRAIKFFKFSVAFFVFGPWGVFTTCEAWTKHARHAKHEQPQHKLLTGKLTGELFKAGVQLKAVFTPPKIGQIEISCSHFKQYKNLPFITQINVLGCFVNFWVIFGYIWKEIIFLEGLVKLKEIRNVEDLGMF